MELEAGTLVKALARVELGRLWPAILSIRSAHCLVEDLGVNSRTGKKEADVQATLCPVHFNTASHCLLPNE